MHSPPHQHGHSPNGTAQHGHDHSRTPHQARSVALHRAAVTELLAPLLAQGRIPLAAARRRPEDAGLEVHPAVADEEEPDAHMTGGGVGASRRARAARRERQ